MLREFIKISLNDPYSKKISIFVLIAVLCLLLFNFISGEKSFSLNYAAILAGIVYEQKRLSANWKTLAIDIGFSLGSGFVVAFALTNFDYIDTLKIWDLLFLLVFALVSVVRHESKVIPVLTEEITLLQSLCFLYWISQFQIFSGSSLIAVIISAATIAFVAFTIYNSFSRRSLNERTRLILSIGTSFITFFFGIDHLIRLTQYGALETMTLLDAAGPFLEFFLLGVSAMYMVQNFIMLYPYFPKRGSPYNQSHRNEIAATNKLHLSRYAHMEVTPEVAGLCIIFCAVLFGANYLFDFWPRSSVIWMAVVFFPRVARLIR